MRKKIITIGVIILIIGGMVFFIISQGNIQIFTTPTGEGGVSTTTPTTDPSGEGGIPSIITPTTTGTITATSTTPTGTITATSTTPSGEDVAATSTESIANDVLQGLPEYLQISTESVVDMYMKDIYTLLYIERDSGTVYRYNLQDRSVQTYTQPPFSGVYDASFSSTGDRVIYTLSDKFTKRFFLGTFAESVTGDLQIVGRFLPENVVDAVFYGITGSSVRYILKTESGGEIHTYTPQSDNDVLVTEIPYNDAYILTYQNAETYYLYTKPNTDILGYIHKFNSNRSLDFVTEGGYGLTAYQYSKGVLVTKYINKKLTTVQIEPTREVVFKQPVKTDACIELLDIKGSFICGGPQQFPTSLSYPNDWYTGEYRFNDMILYLNPSEDQNLIISNPEKVTGQTFDILKIRRSPLSLRQFLLINKNDGILWLWTYQQ